MATSTTIQFKHPLRSVALFAERVNTHTEEEMATARKEEYQRGYAEASRFFEKQIIEQRQEVLHLQQETFAGLNREAASMDEQLRLVLPELTMEAVRRVLAGLEIGRETISRLVEETLEDAAPQRSGLQIFINRRDFDLCAGLEADFAEKYPGLTIQSDDRLASGDVQMRSRFGIIDARVATKLRAVENFLR